MHLKSTFFLVLVLLLTACQTNLPGPTPLTPTVLSSIRTPGQTPTPIQLTSTPFSSIQTVSPTPTPPPIPRTAPSSTPTAAQIIVSTTCGPATATPTNTAQAASPTPTLSPTPTPLLSAAGNLKISEVVRGFNEPDDLYAAPDGTIYVSDTTEGTVSRLGNNGTRVVVGKGFRSPEGIVQLPDKTLLVGEQCTNRLLRLDPTTGQISTFVQLENHTDEAGVDGIALDTHVPGAPSIIVPDGPYGRILRVSLDGKQVSVIATGFQRPAGAWVEPDGSILVADEYANEVIRLGTDGSRHVLAHLGVADDVIEDAKGNIYAISNSDGTVHWVHPGTGQDTVLVQGLSYPQGICFDSAGNLMVTESGGQRVVNVDVRRNQ